MLAVLSDAEQPRDHHDVAQVTLHFPFRYDYRQKGATPARHPWKQWFTVGKRPLRGQIVGHLLERGAERVAVLEGVGDRERPLLLAAGVMKMPRFML